METLTFSDDKDAMIYYTKLMTGASRQYLKVKMTLMMSLIFNWPNK